MAGRAGTRRVVIGKARRAATACAVLAALAAGVRADTFVVDDDGGPGVDFTVLQAAIDAASPGDLIVVRDGAYAGATMHQGVRVVADTGHAPTLLPSGPGLEISGLPVDQVAVVVGLKASRAYVHDNDGSVHLDDLVLGPHAGLATLRAYRNALVVASRCAVEGQDGLDQDLVIPFPGGETAIEVLLSTVAFSGCDVSGGDGATLYKSHGLPGRPALHARDAVVFVQTSGFRGGRGGSFWGPDPSEFDCDGGDGGAALLLLRATVEIVGLPTDAIRGGDTGVPSWLGSPGTPAPAIDATDSDVLHSGASLETYGGVPVAAVSGGSFGAHVLAVPALTLDGDAQLGGSLQLTLHAPAGTQFLMWVSPFAKATPLGEKHVWLLLEPALLFPLASGVVGSFGSFFVAGFLPNDPSLQGLAFHAQAYTRQPGGDALSSSASAVLR